MSWHMRCDHCGGKISGPSMVMFLLDGKEIHICINPSDANFGPGHKDFCPECLLAAAKGLARSLTFEEVQAGLTPRA